MVSSMTGYGRGQVLRDGKEVLVEIKSLNHRYFDFNCRTPRAYTFLEEKIKEVLSAGISRGKVDCFVSLQIKDSESASVRLNLSLLESYMKAFDEIKKIYNEKVIDDVSLLGLTRIPEICSQEKVPEDEDEIWLLVSEALEEALTDFTLMRKKEGERLAADLLSRSQNILDILAQIEASSETMLQKYEAKLKDKMTQLLENQNIDENRIMMEVAIFSERIAICEEIVRLKSHMEQFNVMIKSDTPVGRKLDFIVQEMNREANTIGSKSSDIDVTRLVVEIKSEIEKIREQVQNIE